MKKVVNLALALLSSSLVATYAYGFAADYDQGRVGFYGQVSDTSCSIALNGGQNAGSGNVWLAPVSLAEVHERGAGTFLKPRPFTLSLSNCRFSETDREAENASLRTVNVRWVSGYLVNTVNNENSGYLANALPDGAQRIYLALSTNDNNTLDKRNKIIPADPQQNRVRMQENAANGAVFTYYIGYVTQDPLRVTTGPITSWAVWELTYL